MIQTYTLYGSYASYYTAKVRSYLRKKSIPFIEHLPSDPTFRDTVRPTSGSHRIPQLLTPQGEVIQDSVAIVDHLEGKFPLLPAFPEGPRQRTFVHLMELLGSEGLVRLAWMHRWMFAANDPFVKMDFGRSFRPQGDDDELRKYGNLIAERMTSYGLPESTAEVRAELDRQYLELLGRFESRLQRHPYFLGGHPSAADYAVMGAMHAHLGRDPAGLRTMQDHAPRTFRWVEHMMVPEVQSPEFAHTPVEYAEDDHIPETSLAILRFIDAEYGQPFALDALAFNQAMAECNAAPGYELAPEEDQPALPPQSVEYEGKARKHAPRVYAVWLIQRAQAHFRSQPADVQKDILNLLQGTHAAELLESPLSYRIARINNRFVIT